MDKCPKWLPIINNLFIGNHFGHYWKVLFLNLAMTCWSSSESFNSESNLYCPIEFCLKKCNNFSNSYSCSLNRQFKRITKSILQFGCCFGVHVEHPVILFPIVNLSKNMFNTKKISFLYFHELGIILICPLAISIILHPPDIIECSLFKEIGTLCLLNFILFARRKPRHSCRG